VLVPVHLEVRAVEALLGLELPLVIGRGGAEQVDVVLLPAVE
jgi:hypothetical protein